MRRCEIPVVGGKTPAVIELVEGDITKQEVDAIVNAANQTLLGGGGVDGAIHRAGGPEILEECDRLGGCETGDAKITTGGRLPAKHVIHTVGPVYRDGTSGEPESLASAYRRSLEVADQHQLRSVAFPSISTGAYRYPIEAAARIALATTRAALGDCRHVGLVRFVLHGRRDFEVYEQVLSAVMAADGEA
ncbi:MAG: O-acetyl-ADP-ribose deacetylase [Candidatus Eisenbacteria sp.]|nr:O-acetyl-ADP-ribose deacetylase [Candidatus Eisenbacteria bacterium]